MPSPNLDLVRSILADWERGDFSSVEWADPEINVVVADGPEPGSRTGLAARRWVRGFLNVWESLRFEASEYRELEDGRVLVVYRMMGRGPAGAAVSHVRDGRIVKLTFYWDRDRALAELGLKE
jgi:ketosteroid isomerase-like protein